MLGVIFYLLCGRHHGKGVKNSKEGKYEAALKHFELSLEYAIKSKNEGLISVEMECLAITFFKLGFLDQALHYSQKSLDILSQNQDMGPETKKGIERLSDFIKTIKFKKNT